MQQCSIYAWLITSSLIFFNLCIDFVSSSRSYKPLCLVGDTCLMSGGVDVMNPRALLDTGIYHRRIWSLESGAVEVLCPTAQSVTVRSVTLGREMRHALCRHTCVIVTRTGRILLSLLEYYFLYLSIIHFPSAGVWWRCDCCR